MSHTHITETEIGRDLALRLGYPEPLLDAIPTVALASFAGVGYHLDLAALGRGSRVLDLGSGSGTDAFSAGTIVGHAGRVVGVDFTDARLAKARRLAEHEGTTNVTFVEGSVQRLPFGDDTFDVVISNGVVGLAPDRRRLFAEAARVLRPGGRLAVADIVCVNRATPTTSYLNDLAAAGFNVARTRRNDYRLAGDRAMPACRADGVESLTFAATLTTRKDRPR